MFMRAGFGAAVHVVHAVLLTAVVSATYSCFYASSRVLLVGAIRTGVPRISSSKGVAFTWLLNITGISMLLVWTSIGVISSRFPQAYTAGGLSLVDLALSTTSVSHTACWRGDSGNAYFIAQGYSAVRQAPFEPKNVVATYIGVALCLVLYSVYTVYGNAHFVPTSKVDFVTDAV
ncbi:hypothetical protein FPV67DRAFT_1473363 [Lyophyllum atratum]|nr:hypothetical protein FPV67DRAFT_1473363 [Lyophyllum atratum]